MNLSFEERFEALRREWRGQLPQRLQEIQSKLAACRAAPDDTEGLRDLHRMLHTLAGSAGTFGLDALGARAREIEHAIDPLLEQPERAAAELDGIDASMQALLAAAPNP
jgi:HPt (histidine-containing phosphotransfer) domain-containing protein